MNVSRLDFINRVLKVLNPSVIYCGEDYRFGKEALGTPKFLSHYFKVNIVELKKYKENKYSSKWIRKLIYEGNIKEATYLKNISKEELEEITNNNIHRIFDI